MVLDGTDVRSHDGDDDPDFQTFRKEMEIKDEIKRVKAEEQSAFKKLQRFSNQKRWRQQLKRTQQYLGLNAARTPTAGSIKAVYPDLEGLTITTQAVDGDSDLPIHNNLNSVPKDLDSSIIFISIDIEAFEFSQKLITEIGISTLDTADLLGVQPGARGNNWAAKMQSRHFRIREHGHLLNRVHVEGCADKFDFGQSEWIYERDVLSVLEECFNPPSSLLDMYPSRTRKVILVAHDVASDMKYLKELGFDVTRMISDCIDTSDLYKVSRRNVQQSALSSLLLQYGIGAKHLHNAGNDAHYTLRVMVAMALHGFQNKRNAEEWELEKRNRIEAACEAATAKVCAEFEGWSTSEDEDEDAADSPTLPLSMGRQKGKEAPGFTQGQYKSDSKPSVKRGDPRRRGRPGYLTHIDGTLSEVAVQDNPIFQDVSADLFISVPAGRQFGKQDDGGHAEARGRGRGRGRGYNRGRGRGRGSIQDNVQSRGRGKG